MKNKVNISIDGKPFTLVGTESEEYIESVADYVNEKIAFIRESDKNSFLTRDLAVILTCVNLADELFKEREKTKGIDPEENAALKDTVSELEDEIDDLLNYNRKLTEEFEEERDALEREKEDLTEDEVSYGDFESSEAGEKIAEMDEKLGRLLEMARDMEVRLRELKAAEDIRSIDTGRSYRARAYGNKEQ